MALVATTQLFDQIASRQTSRSQDGNSATDRAKQRLLRLVQTAESRPSPFPTLKTPVSPLYEPPCQIKITDTSGKPMAEDLQFMRINSLLDVICRYVSKIQDQQAPRQSGFFKTIRDSDVINAMRSLPPHILKAAYDDLLFISKNSSSEEVRKEAARICWNHLFIRFSGRVSRIRPPPISAQDPDLAFGQL